MAIRSTNVAVTSTATALVTGTDADRDVSSRDIAMKNTSAVTVFVGGAGVTTATGFPVEPTETVTFANAHPESLLYAVVATGTATVAVLEAGV